MRYMAPLRCESCGREIRKKPNAKTPKYCPECRERKQQIWKDQRKKVRQR